MTFSVALDDYPDILPTEAVLSIIVEPCQIKSLSSTQVPAQVYEIFKEAKEFNFLQFVQSPACSYQLEYEVRLKDKSGSYSELPLFMSYNELALRAESSEISDLGDYDISVVAVVVDGNQIENISEELIIDFTVLNGCKDDEVTTDFTVDAVTFDIGVSNDVEIRPTWNANTISGCPTTFELFRVVG